MNKNRYFIIQTFTGESENGNVKFLPAQVSLKANLWLKENRLEGEPVVGEPYVVDIKSTQANLAFDNEGTAFYTITLTLEMGNLLDAGPA